MKKAPTRHEGDKPDRRELFKRVGAGLVAGSFGGILMSRAEATPAPAPVVHAPRYSTLEAVWVHGTIVVAESPQNLVPTPGVTTNGMLRNGSGSTFYLTYNSLSWFHIPITTPVFMGGVRPQLAKAFVLFRSNRANIIAVHLYDGESKVKAFENLNLSGAHSLTLDSSNTFPVNPAITIQFGLGISVAVSTTGRSTIGLPEPIISFATAGADFIKP